MIYGWQPISLNILQQYATAHLAEWMAQVQKLKHTLEKVGLPIDVHVLNECLTPLPQPESEILSQTEGWVREVYLKTPNAPLVYARTAMPVQTFEQFKKDWETLGNKGIGDTLLYHQAHVKRSPFEFGLVRKQNQLYQDATKNTPHRPFCLWGRRSLFYWDGYPLLITELFLPDFIRATDQCLVS